MSMRFFSAASCASACASAEVSVRGFSQKTCLPASNAFRTISAWVGTGVAMATASMAWSAQISSTVARRACGRAGSLVLEAKYTSSLAASNSRATFLPHLPTPIIAVLRRFCSIALYGSIQVMRVLLTTGIIFPDVGGPAIHVQKIAEHFATLGWQVTVVAFGDHKASGEDYRVIRISRASGKLVSWLLYGIAVARESLRHDVIYAFDLTTAGIPSALFSRIFRKPFILRIGGDSLWERVVEKGERSIPMRAYYEQGLFKKDRPTLYRLVRFVVRRADTVVIPCGFLKDLYIRFYGVSAEKITLIQNPFPPKSPAMIEEDTFTFLFAGRFVSYKNLVRVLKVFSDIAEKYPHARLVLIGRSEEH